MSTSQATAALSRQQPPWREPPRPPGDHDLPPLSVWNSLTRSKTPFYPLDWQHKTVSLYACGVTPYDDAHLGHIRNYTTLDIVVRILRDYFKFRVRFVMNVTDVDDKIILRARQRHLLESFLGGQLQIDEQRAPNGLVPVGTTALHQYLSKNLKDHLKGVEEQKLVDLTSTIEKNVASLAPDNSSDGIERRAKLNMHIRTVVGASKALEDVTAGREPSQTDKALLEDVLMPFLDTKASVDASDHSVFTKLARKYEDRFWEDLRSMNCLPVPEITRVTEYIPQIVAFIERIEKNGFAYKTRDGSVYFDIGAFEKARNQYPRLEPWSRNDAGLQADGEGALTKATSEKRGFSDFALWKSSKAGEPAWPSPWGQGRPGWHIECSAMASDKLGEQFDIHSGGIDLAFPHHDNELAQSEAYWGQNKSGQQHQWVNYFLHMGHLSIAGAKMSKSLKNFTTIREALSRGDWTPRGLRIIFLLGGWRDGVEIKEGLIKEGAAWEDKLNNFFLKAKEMERIQRTEGQPLNGEHSPTSNNLLEKAQTETYTALCDSFNTAKVMELISELISSVNASPNSSPSETLAAAHWITSMVNTFGLNGDSAPDAASIGWSGLDVPEESRALLTALSQMRDQLRSLARSEKHVQPENLHSLVSNPRYRADAFEEASPESKEVLINFKNDLVTLDEKGDLSKDVLQLCDKLRDVDLWNQDVYLEDRDSGEAALVRPVTRELRAAREEKEERERQKAAAKLEREREAAIKAEKGRLSHLEMYKTEEYSEWDEEGIPTKDAKGEEVTKSKRKKLKSLWDRQKKMHEVWTKANV